MMVTKSVPASNGAGITRSFRRGRLSGQVVAEIERLVHEEYREPGSRLPKESELADRFHVSRIVIREAMKILEERGVVEVRAGRGSLSAAPSPDRVKASLMRLFQDQPLPTLRDMELMLELRESLEEAVAGLASLRATPEDLAEISSALDEMASGKSVESTIEADLRFHVAIAKAAHNRFYEMVLQPITQVYLQQIKLTDSYDVGVELHRSVFDQIRKGDPVGSRQAVRRLIRRTKDHIKTALAAVESARTS